MADCCNFDEIKDVLASLRVQGVGLWVDRGNLRYCAPEGVLTSELIMSLRKWKQEIIGLIAGPHAEKMADPTAEPESSVRRTPLTFQQEWLWNLLHRNPEWKCLMTRALRLSGTLNIASVRVSLAAVVRRHESLRTAIVLIDGVPTQEIDPDGDCDLDVVDLWKDEPGYDVDEEARLTIQAFFRHRIDPARGPLFLVKLFRLSQEEHVLAVAIHHIVSDAKSLTIVFRELWSFYWDTERGRGQSCLKEPLQYSDYAIWQRYTQRSVTQTNAVYWRRRLSGAQRVRWPGSENAKDLRNFPFATIQVALEKTLSSSLLELARMERTVPAMIALAIFSALIWRVCNQNDFVIPFNVVGRQNAEHEDVTGYFAHILLLRIELTGEESLIDVLRLVAREFITAWEHTDFGRTLNNSAHLWGGTGLQWLSWDPEQLAGIHNPPPDDHVSDLRMEPFPVEVDGLVDIRVGGEIDTGPEIGFVFVNTPQGICANGFYRADLFLPGTMARISRLLRILAEQFARDPAVRLASVGDDWRI